MDHLTLSLLLRATMTALFVLSMSWLVARAPQPVAAVAIAMPVVIGPGFLMLALDRDPAFVMRAAETGLGAMAATVVFAVAVVRLAGRLDRVQVMAAALVAWVATALAAGFVTGWATNAGVFGLAYAAGMHGLRGTPASGRPRVDWSPGRAAVRALAAGVLVGAVTLAATWLGPVLSATLIALPVGLIFVAVWALGAASPVAARQVMAAGARGTVALALFLVVLRGLLPLGLSPVLAVGLATLSSVALAIAVGLRPAGPG